MPNKFVKLLSAFWAIPLVLIIKGIKPFIHFRFGIIDSTRIGHFNAQAIMYHAYMRERPRKTVDLFWFSKNVSNTHWEKMVRRELKIHWSVFYLVYWLKKLFLDKTHILKPSTRDLYGKVKNHPGVPFPFLPEEDEQAKNWLRQQGWNEGEKIVCLFVRDAAFLSNAAEVQAADFSYHNYRDTNIADYMKAVEWLAGQGVWVLRMGSLMAHPIPIKHPKVIDYAFHPAKSPLLDIWLFTHCDLCISSGVGLDSLTEFYKKPILFVNYVPLCNIWSWCDSVNLPKHLFWKDTEVPLTWKQHLIHNYVRTEDYEKAGIQIKDLNADEILAATQESWQRIAGTWTDTTEDQKRQQRFWEILRTWRDFDKKHHWIHPDCRISVSWLRNLNYEFL